MRLVAVGLYVMLAALALWFAGAGMAVMILFAALVLGVALRPLDAGAAITGWSHRTLGRDRPLAE